MRYGTDKIAPTTAMNAPARASAYQPLRYEIRIQIAQKTANTNAIHTDMPSAEKNPTEQIIAVMIHCIEVRVR